MVTAEYKPDCGYAWIVVAACFTINLIMAGLARAAGVLYIALIDVYGVTRETATAPFSLRFCIRNMSGPAVGALGQRFGIRPVVLLGGLICGLGGILSALAPDVTWITVAWGGLHGLGYGMCNMIHLIMINRYFNKYKGLAIGISLTGDCVGTFLLPPVLEYLLAAYDLRGTFLIMAAVSLNVVPAAMLLKPPPWEKTSTRVASVSYTENEPIVYNNETDYRGKNNEGFDVMSEDCHISLGSNNMDNCILPVITVDETKNKQKVFKDRQSLDNQMNVAGTVETECPKTHDRQYLDFSNFDRSKNKILNDAVMNDINSLRQSASLRVTEGKIKKNRFRFSPNSFMKNRRTSAISVLSCPSQLGKFTFDLGDKNCTNSSNICSETPKNVLRQCYPKEILPPQHAKDLEFVNDSDTKLSIISPCEKIKFNDGKTTTIDEEREDLDDTVEPPRNSLYGFLKTNIKPIFLVISATLALYVFLFISVFTIIVDYVHDNSVPIEYGTYLIIAFSVTDFFGRIGFGIVLDKKWMPLRHYAVVTVGLMGLFVAIIPFYKCLIFWMISFSFCGFVQGGVAIMFPVLVDYYMERNEETVALGCLNFYGGVLMLPIPPMIGYFRDNIGSYDGVFFTVGSLCIFVASLWLLEPFLVRKQKDIKDRGNTREKTTQQSI